MRIEVLVMASYLGLPYGGDLNKAMRAQDRAGRYRVACPAFPQNGTNYGYVRTPGAPCRPARSATTRPGGGRGAACRRAPGTRAAARSAGPA